MKKRRKEGGKEGGSKEGGAGGKEDEDGREEEVWNYVFDKEFHVSPFMDMNHVYDWEFVGPREGGREGGAGCGMWVTTHMLKKEGRERYVVC
jgi:hypothetical protein